MVNNKVAAFPSFPPLILPVKISEDIYQLANFICGSPNAKLILLEIPKKLSIANGRSDDQVPHMEDMLSDHLSKQPNELFIIEDIQKDQSIQNCTVNMDCADMKFLAVVPIPNANGSVAGILCIQDINPKQLTQGQKNALKNLANQTATLIGLGKEKKPKKKTLVPKLGYWSLNLKDSSLFWSEEVHKIWERDKDSFELNYANFLDTIHPDDQETFARVTNEAISNNRIHDFTHRIILPDGSIKWVHELGLLVLDKAGKPKVFEGTVQDISQQKREEHQWRLVESVVTNTKDAVLITEAEPFDKPGPRIIFVNEAFTKMTGYTAKEVIGKTPRILQGPKTDREALKRLGEAIRKWKPYELTIINYKKNGEEFWSNFSLNPVADETGWYTHWIAIERDVTEQKNQELQRKLLADISQHFNQEETLHLCLTKVLEHLVEFGNYTFGEIWLPNIDANLLKLTAKYTDKEAGYQFYKNCNSVDPLAYGQGLPGTVWQTQQVEVWDNIVSNQAFLRGKAAEISGMEMVIGVPLTHNNTIIGVLVLGYETENKPLSLNEELFIQLETHLGAEIKRKRLELELDQIFKFAPDIVCVTGTDGYIKKINPAGARLLEYSEKELLSRPYLELIHPDDRPNTAEAHSKLMDQQKIKNQENRYITKSGKTIWLSWTASPSPEDGLIFAIAKDITKNKKLRELLNMANKLAQIGSWELDLLTNTVYWSDITKKIYGVDNEYQPSSEQAKGFYQIEPYASKLSAYFKEAVNKGEAWDIEMPIVTGNGLEQWVRMIGNSEFKNNHCIRIYGSIQNIHELKVAQLAYKKAFNENHKILESIGDAFISVDKNWAVNYWNKQSEELLGMSRKDILGKQLWEIIPDSSDYDFYKNLKKSQHNKKKITFEEFHPEFNLWFEVNAYPSINGISIFIKDVSARIAAEENIKLSNERFEKATEATNDAIYDRNLNDNILFFSKGFKTLFGHDINNSSDNLQLWKRLLHPDDAQLVQVSFNEALNNQQTKKWEAEYRFQKANGEYTHVRDMAILVRNPLGKAIRIVGAISDIGLRKMHEESLKKLNQELKEYSFNIEEQNKKFKEIAWTQSHIVRAPVARLMGIIELFKEDMLEFSEKEKMLDHILDSAHEIDDIINDIVQKSRSIINIQNKNES
ncbi:PAS domain S-box protein [Arenibacter sp. F26102]|uniref:PAS domain S-box protein n=1 Tax=Arenibacter sp. F26102 TaxID=2926416 RepID=UPI001FF2328B|nr:PAS domain S-box protein [Arenibacter sp. F26102]MCK0147104.1 PAS domain S-box protein [Arenibacter sp. F26102]